MQSFIPPRPTPPTASLTDRAVIIQHKLFILSKGGSCDGCVTLQDYENRMAQVREQVRTDQVIAQAIREENTRIEAMSTPELKQFLTLKGITADDTSNHRQLVSLAKNLANSSRTRSQREIALPGQPVTRNVRCGLGHSLSAFLSQGRHFCNRCGRYPRASSSMFGCRACDFDLCDICYMEAPLGVLTPTTISPVVTIGSTQPAPPPPLPRRQSNTLRATTCPSNHPISEFHSNGGFYCDCCKIRPAAGTSLWGCRICNFDYCEQCVNASEAERLTRRRQQRPELEVDDVSRLLRVGVTFAMGGILASQAQSTPSTLSTAKPTTLLTLPENTPMEDWVRYVKASPVVQNLDSVPEALVCSICFVEKKNCSMRCCGIVYCRNCIAQVFSEPRAVCPNCRKAGPYKAPMTVVL